jgi:gamma-glutamylcyclotransferase (GGCT)/AIG2-like uncharacterized protein YtfP
MKQENKHRVFVYGTLKRGHRVRGLDHFGSAEFVGESETVDSDYNMWCLGAFPAISMDGESRVRGEVWDVDDGVMAVLDNIEGYPDFYNRTQVSTTQGDAWVYFLNSEDIKQFRMHRKLNGSTLEWTDE